ncbi:MAG: ATP-dependent sacrificial sulfur transferase LarE [Candidatus Omnitrophica bacterium]|nr:ATP-dependent sacrificial sulfur transferase LarE [Candidatus Omnitrophota bacterium]
MDLEAKYLRLKEILKKMDSVLIAFSGGLDSTFLLKVASMVLHNDKILAVTAKSPIYPKREICFSKKITRRLKIRHKIIRTEELKDKRFTANTFKRCYFCKLELFKKLKEIAKKNHLNFVIEASNLSDEKDFRPGNKAKKVFKIHSPLKEVGFTKEDIRKLSKRLGLITWNKPSLACLASRIPYGIKITRSLLKRIEKAEDYLRSLGFSQVRLRHYDGLCRIEVFKKDIPKVISKKELIITRLKRLGYNYITLDLEGYRTGSLNEIIKNN